MPSEIMDLKSLPSSSFFSEDVCFPNERQVGFWKTDTTLEHHVSSPLEKQIPVESQILKSFKPSDPNLIRDQKVNVSLAKSAVGAERAASHSLQRAVDADPGMTYNSNMEPSSCYSEGDRIHAMGAEYENSLFSSSFSELFSRKLRMASKSALYGHSVGAAASHYEEEEPLESLEEIEAQTIGNLLPKDDDLLSGVTDGLDSVAQPTDAEDFDLFSSVGGLDLGEDGFSPRKRGPEFSRQHPSRTLFVRNINSNVEHSELQALFEEHGDIRALYTACKSRGFVMVSYYDIRSAQNAMRALQHKPLRHRRLDIRFSIPKDNPFEKDINQGIFVVYNLDSSVSTEELHQIFGKYGEIKEIREIPHQNDQRFIEFYDIRAAEAALCALNRSNIAGKQIKLEPILPGSARQCLVLLFPPEVEQDESGQYLRQSSSPGKSTTGFPGSLSHGGITSAGMNSVTIPGVQSALKSPTSAPGLPSPVKPYMESMFHNGLSSNILNGLHSLVRVESRGSLSSLPGTPTPNFHPQSLPEYRDALTNSITCSSPTMAANISARSSERFENHQFCRMCSNGHPLELNDAVFGSCGNGSCSPGHQYIWSSSPRPNTQGLVWPNSPTFINGVCTAHPPPQLHAIPRVSTQMLNTIVPLNNRNVGSAPSMNPSLWDRRRSYSGESPDASGFHPGSLGNLRISSNSPHHLELLSPNMFPHVGGNCMDLSKSVGMHSPYQNSAMFPSRGQMIPVVSSFESPNEQRTRSRRSDGSSNQADNKKQFELDLERIIQGEDNRTTLMIKNIPNKYTSKMLLAAIDERHKGTYDFIYLPIDFKNKCNVGYAFINMTAPSMIIPFYQTFNGKKWEKFNSEKVASLAYARIQGKAALIAHFQNSSLMNEDKRCRPILFNTEGPNAGDQVPFPMGVNVRSRVSRTRANSNEESPLNLPNGEESSKMDSSSGSSNDSD
ncbi:hypothetical protein NMG60_11031000 [Bertholletia excelsa]